VRLAYSPYTARRLVTKRTQSLLLQIAELAPRRAVAAEDEGMMDTAVFGVQLRFCFIDQC